MRQRLRQPDRTIRSRRSRAIRRSPTSVAAALSRRRGCAVYAAKSGNRDDANVVLHWRHVFFDRQLPLANAAAWLAAVAVVASRPKGHRDCGNHEWYRSTEKTDACYHCRVGQRPHAGPLEGEHRGTEELLE